MKGALCLRKWASIIAMASLTAPALAGGGGQNMLLVVNPLDENAMRIATAYQKIRGIPDSNIVFQETLQTTFGFQRIGVDYTTRFKPMLDTLQGAINSRGLADHVDYIATLGLQSNLAIDKSRGFSEIRSAGYLLSNMTQFTSGAFPIPGSLFGSSKIAQTNLSLNSNTVIRHAQKFDTSNINDPTQLQYYMAGALANTGQFGSNANHVIAQLQRTANGDGTKPQGTIYFEENNDIRSNTRESQWPGVKAALDARGIPWVESHNTPGSTPLNRPDVRGAVVGKAVFTLPNGSTYLPGSWVDSLTSNAATYGTHGQSRATQFVDAGAGASSGTVTEPFAIAGRFPNASIHVFNADGSTLGEAFYKSVNDPVLQLFVGDLLAQPYADVPDVAITAGPANGSTVSGNSLQIAATASLNSATLATGVKQVELWVDGKLHDTVLTGNANFNLDTTTLSDGRHELRLVATNNAAAESQGFASRIVTVNNQGRSVQIATGNVVVEGSQTVALNVNANAGNSGATIERVELRNLGRVVGSVNSSTGSITLSPGSTTTLMGYGDNEVTPVAIYSDGQEVAGNPITLTRNPNYQQGSTPTAQANRVAGIKAEYFLGQGGVTIATSDFTQKADIETNVSKLLMGNTASTRVDRLIERGVIEHPTTQIDKLAIRYSGLFEVGVGDKGEYTFTPWATNDSLQLSVDGQLVMNYDKGSWNINGGGDLNKSIFLDEGEHDFELLVANVVNPNNSSKDLNRFDAVLYMRGPDSVTRLLDDSFIYQAVPEPATGAILLCGGLVLLRRKHRRTA